MTMSRHSARDQARVTTLALKAGRGDRHALTEFIRSTQDDVWRLLAHLAGRDSADDLTQETYLRVIRALPNFAAHAPARTWLLSIARRTWVDTIRRDRARPRTAALPVENTDSLIDGTTAEPTWSEWIDLRTLIDALPPERREALILTQVLGYTYEEAARIAGVRLGTIRSRVARARRDLLAASRVEG